ncbi:hypothetical protein TanjilG_28941 [Lupinus angustifolius]|uniref:Uncharacterized protein n=1 Tax=Lupinus angustifolius TaxID=3871 RepID=A0A4P1QXS3_LUPAN|nr:PREDICTED: uncharacterized protein LOC109327905 [Lupinus angustifolius]OIV97190.1 hypothetical protein TanjilG_28941 [Lupinus angustifolius]
MAEVKHQTQSLMVPVTAAKESQNRLPMRRLKKMLRKMVSFVHKKKEAHGSGRGGVWQKQIIMGDKCEPLDFSGVISYDSNGNQVTEIPFKPSRASGQLTERGVPKV